MKTDITILNVMLGASASFKDFDFEPGTISADVQSDLSNGFEALCSSLSVKVA